MTEQLPTIATWYASNGSHGLTAEEIDQLARFNGESARGLVHTEEYATRMAALQARFDANPGSQTPGRRGWLRWRKEDA